VLEEGLAAKVLVIRVLYPAGDDSLVPQVEGVLEVEEPCNKPRRCRWPSHGGREEPGPFALEELQSINSASFASSCRRSIMSVRRGRGFITAPEIARFQDPAYETPQFLATDFIGSGEQSQVLGSCSGRTP